METVISQTVNQTSLISYMTEAKSAGVSADQITRFVQAGYVALPWQLRFHAAARLADQDEGPVMIAGGGARGPGKSHACLAQAGLDDCQRFNGLKWLFLRKIAKSAQESFEDLIARVFAYQPHKYTPSTNTLEFPNGSRIKLGGFNNENDIDSYLGIEYDGIIIEEWTQLSERKTNMLRGSLRTSRRDWRPRLYGSTNPGGIGHAAFKNTFVTPYRMGKETITRFIPSTYRDNPFLNREYIEYLESLTGSLGKAWRDGSWDVFEGMAFPLWNDDVHVVDPFDIPANWLRVGGLDWGYANPFCHLWSAKDPDTGRIIVYREAYEKQLTDRQQARLILDMTPVYERVQTTFADPSMWATKSQEDIVTSTAKIYMEIGLMLTRADNNRLAGKRKVDRLLGMLPDGRPGLVIFKNCVNLRRTLPELTYDPVHVEDVDTEGEDHAYDALKYNLTVVHEANERAPRPQQKNPYLTMRHI